jgi:Spy/CpxP family protein refolding chaperone
MKTKVLVLLLVASVAGNVAFAATTFIAGRQRAALPMDRLGLDDAQRTKLLATREQFARERGRARARMATLRDDFAAEVAKPTPDRARMLQITSEMTSIQAEMRPKLLAHLLDMHQILRPAQRVQLAGMLKSGTGSAAMPGCPGAALAPQATPGEAR